MVVLGTRRVCQPPRLLENLQNIFSRLEFRSARIGALFHVPMAFQAAMVLAVIDCSCWPIRCLVCTACTGHRRCGTSGGLVDLGGLRGEITVADLHIGNISTRVSPVRCAAGSHHSNRRLLERGRRVTRRSGTRCARLEAPPQVTANCRFQGGPLHRAAAGCLLRCGLFWVRDARDSRGRCARKAVQRSRPRLESGGKVLLFEHGWDAHNYVIFGPVIHHVDQAPGLGQILARAF